MVWAASGLIAGERRSAARTDGVDQLCHAVRRSPLRAGFPTSIHSFPLISLLMMSRMCSASCRDCQAPKPVCARISTALA